MGFIEKSNVPISFQGGLQSKTDSLQLQPPALLELQNARFDKIGSLNKRFGYDILTQNIMGGGTIQSAFAIDNFNEELNLFDNQNIYTYIQSVNSWANRGPAISLINSNNQIIRTEAAQQINPDSAYLNGIEVFAWEDSRGGVRHSVIDRPTQSYCLADQSTYPLGAKPKTIAFNGLVYIFYTDSVNNLWYRTVNPNNPNVVPLQVDVFSDGYLGFSYDVCVASNKLFITYQANDGYGKQIKLFSMNGDQTLNPKVTVANDQAVALNVVGDSQNHVWVSWSNGSEVRTSIWNSTPATPTSVLSNTLIDTVACLTLAGIESNNAGALQLVYEVFNLNPSNEQVKSTIIKTNGTQTFVGSIRSVGLASKPFRYNNNLFIQLTHQSALQSTYFMAFLTNSPFTIVGKVSAQVGGGLRTNYSLCEVNTIDSGIFLWANLVKGQFISEDNTNFSLLGVNATTVDFTNVNKFNSLTQNNNLLFVGGILQSYDGTSVSEQNFHLFPEDAVALPSGNDGALSAGQYQYQIVYAWADKFGQIQYSSPSPAITVTTIVNNHVDLYIPTLRLTAKTNVIIKIYRTPVNGTVFQEVTSELAPLHNDPTVDTVHFVDRAADISIAANSPIYTTGGVLPNSAPPSCSLISFYQDRVMLSGLEDPNLIWFSKNKFNASNFNTIPVEFSPDLTIAVNQLGGPITALGLMDDALIIFKKSSIFVLTGDGPNDEGGGDQFAPPQLVSNSVGCTNPNSVVLSKDGLMFQSDKGIWILPRGLGAPQFIGAPVDDDTKQHTISSATVDPNDNLIIFTTFDGPALVYDYFINQWVHWTNHNSIDGIAFNGKFIFCKSNGQIYSQNRIAFTDAGAFVPLSLTTPWMSFSGMLGYQRVFRTFLLGQFKGRHSLNISVGYDFDQAFTQTATIDATSVAGSNLWGSDGYWGESTPWGGVYQPYMFQINFGKQTCTALRMKIEDSQFSPYTEGYTLSNLSFEVGALSDHNRLPIANKVGTR